MCKQHYTTVTCKSAYISRRFRPPTCTGSTRRNLGRIPCGLPCPETEVEEVDVTEQHQGEGQGSSDFRREVMWCSECEKHYKIRGLLCYQSAEKMVPNSLHQNLLMNAPTTGLTRECATTHSACWVCNASRRRSSLETHVGDARCYQCSSATAAERLLKLLSPPYQVHLVQSAIQATLHIQVQRQPRFTSFHCLMPEPLPVPRRPRPRENFGKPKLQLPAIERDWTSNKVDL